MRGRRITDGFDGMLATKLGAELWQTRDGFVTKLASGEERVWPTRAHAFHYLKGIGPENRTSASQPRAEELPVPNCRGLNEAELPTKLRRYKKVVIPCPQCGRRFETSAEAVIRQVNQPTKFACGHEVVLCVANLRNAIRPPTLLSYVLPYLLWFFTPRGRQYLKNETDLWFARQFVSQAEAIARNKAAREAAETRRELSAERAGRRDYVLRMSPVRFEAYVAEIFRALGYAVKMTAATHDEGVDAYLEKEGRRAIVQCKHYTVGKVSRPEIQQLFGVLTHKKVDEAFFLTTATFSSHAEVFAGGKPIHLIDLDKLIAMAKRAFGDTYVSARAVTAPASDEEIISAQDVERLTENLAEERISPVMRTLRGSVLSLVALLLLSWFSYNLLFNSSFLLLRITVGFVVGSLILGALMEKLSWWLF